MFVAALDANGALHEHSPLEPQLHATLNLVPAHAWYALPGGALTFVNERTADYIGLARDHPLRFGVDTAAGWDSHLALLHPDDREETRRVWSECLRQGCAGEVSFRVRNAAGEHRWFLSRAEPVRSANGTVRYWVGVNFDVEERKQAEFYLAEGQRLSHTGSWAFTVAGFEHWSAELFQIYGLDPAGNPPAEEEYLALVHREDREFVDQKIEEMLTTQRPFDFTKRIVRPNGEIRSVRCVGVPATQAGTFRGFVGTGMDVTEQQHLVEALRNSEEELRQMLDFAPQLIAVYIPKREPVYANRAALDYSGLNIDEWRQTEARGAFVHPDDRERELAYFAGARTDGSAGQLELRLRGGDGSYVGFWPATTQCATRMDKSCAGTSSVPISMTASGLKTDYDRKTSHSGKKSIKPRCLREIIGTSPALQRVLSHISKVAPTDSTVLVTGETGTGKELVARAVHRRSNRAARAFISVNCAAIPRDLIASELFGHEKGAFTGAMQRRIGRFELADGGTIFLDEVGELSPDTQIALLRVLQEREFQRVGGEQTLRADVRVIAATNRDLKGAVANGTFRKDLYYRLNVFPLEAPPLRARGADIPLLVKYFVDRYGGKRGKISGLSIRGRWSCSSRTRGPEISANCRTLSSGRSSCAKRRLLR
jgi:PAS domain S-box-containing protein